MANDGKERANELQTLLIDALNKIANRIDRGFTLEIRYEPPALQTGNDSSGNASPNATAFELLGKVVPKITFPESHGERVLSLPEAKEREDALGKEPER